METTENKKNEQHAKNVLIRDLTEEQSNRLLQLQKKFGVKTNSQALLLLLRYCVFFDDEVQTLIDMYNKVASEIYSIMELYIKTEQDTTELEKCLGYIILRAKQLEHFLNMKK